MTTTNGAPADPQAVRSQLKDTRAKIKLIEAQAQLASMERRAKLLESLWLGRDDWWGSDLWDVVMPRDQTGYAHMPPTVASDRRHGNNWPLYQDEQTLSRLRMRSRILTQTGGYGEGLLRNIVNYACGSGGTYEVISKEKLPDADPDVPGVQPTDALEQGIQRVQDFLDNWLQRNAWNCCADPSSDEPLGDSGEVELCSRLFQDGEAFARMYGEDDGLSVVRYMEPEQVVNPPGAAPADGWSWGVRHQMAPYEDVRRPLEYHFAWSDQTTAQPGDTVIGEVVDANEVVHVRAPGTRSTVKRGRPFFSYETASALERASKLQGNASWGAAIRAATAETWQHKIGTGDQVSALEQGLAARTRLNPRTGNTEYILDSRPGQRRRIPDGQELVPPSPDQTQSYLSGVQGDLRQAGVAAAAPEYLVSGDASTNNFASIKEAGTPFVRFVEAVQGLLRSAFLRIIWKALRWAARRGVFDRALLPLIDVQVELPQLVQRDSLQAAQEDQIAIQTGWDDPKSAAMRRGYDWDTVCANRQEYEEMFGQAGPELPLPGGGGQDGGGSPFGGGPNGGGGEPPARPFPGSPEGVREAGADDDPEARADLIAEILAALYARHGVNAADLFDRVNDVDDPDPEDVAEGRVWEAWADIDHPRGKGGKFIPKNSPEAHAAAKEEVGKALKEKPTPEGLKKLTEHLSILTVAQLHALKKEHGLKASGATKEALRQKIADRLHRGRREPAGPGPKAGVAAPALKPAAPAAPPTPKGAPVSKNGQPAGSNGNKTLPDHSRPKLDGRERDAIETYTGQDYAALNAALRNTGKVENPDLAQVHAGLQSALAKAETFPAPVPAFRGMKLDPAATAKFEKMLQGAQKAGAVVRIPGYSSTSTGGVPKGFEGNVEVRIAATHGIDASPYSTNQAERELILGHNAGFRVDRVERGEGGRLVVHMTQVEKGGA